MSSPLSPRRFSIDSLVCQSFWLLLCLIGVLGILSLNNGRFSYTLDDSYIHLAVAEEMAKGNYGVNPGEFTAPSSSIIWPFLLAPFAFFRIDHFAPLGIGIVSISLSIEIILRRLRVWIPDSPGDGGASLTARVLATAATLMFANAAWLVFTGLEHGLQILVSIATVDAILAGLAGERLRPWHYVAICSGPLVRYECLSFTGAAAFFFLLQKHWSRGLVLLAIPLLLLAAYSAFLLGHGYSAVPNSVLAKSSNTGASNLLNSLPDHLEGTLRDGRGLLLALMILPLLSVAWIRRPWDKFGMAGLALGLAGILHLLLRGMDLQNRYDPYMLAGLFFGLVGIGVGMAPRPGPAFFGRLAAMLVLFAFASTFQYLRSTLRIPLAGNNIYEQQYHMHRFATEYWKRPVAVNDLGWVSYRNDNYVLDLWGLASKEALVARMNRGDKSWMAEMTRDKGVGLAMIYPGWFPSLPTEWERVGTLNLSQIAITPSFGWVAFYATDPNHAPELRELLRQFSTTLPPDVVLEIVENKSP